MRYSPFSPILAKELIQMASNKRSFVFKCVFLAITFAISSLILLMTLDADQTTIGVGLFNTVAYIELMAIMLYLPVITAGVVSGEQEAKTLHLLFLTKLNPWNIAQDKALSRMMQILYICTLTWPLMFCSLLFGGITVGQILTTLAYLVGMALICSAAGILCSSFYKSFAAALVVTYVLIILSLIVPFSLLVFGAMGQQTIAYCPLVAIGICTSSNYWLAAGVDFALASCIYAGIGIVLYVIALVVAVLRICKARKGKGKRNGVMGAVKDTAVGFVQAFIGGAPADGPGWNAMFWKNCNLRGDGLKRVMCTMPAVLFLGYVVVLLVGVFVEGDDGGQVVSAVAATVGFPLVLLLNCVLSANLFSGERKKDTLDILLTTRLEGRSIMWGMLLAHIRYSMWLWLFPLATFAAALVFGNPKIGMVPGGIVIVGGSLAFGAAVVMALLNYRKGLRRMFERMFHGAGVVLLLTSILAVVAAAIANQAIGRRYDPGICWAVVMWPVHCTFFAVLGIRISIWAKTAVRAIAITLAMAAGLCVGIPILAGLLSTAIEFEFLTELMLSFSPAGSLVMGISSRSTMEHSGLMIFNILLYAFLALVIFTESTLQFDRSAGRQRSEGR